MVEEQTGWGCKPTPVAPIVGKPTFGTQGFLIFLLFILLFSFDGFGKCER